MVRDGACAPPHHEEPQPMNPSTTLSDIPLPAGIRSRYVDDVNGLRMHVLEAGYETRGRPCVLLLHGFPELAYSWRPTSAATAAPPAGTRAMTATWPRSGCSTWCAMRSAWYRPSAIARSTPW